MNSQPRIERVPCAGGFRWVGRGADLVAAGGLRLVPVALMLLIISVVQFLPVFGPLLLIVCSPAITAGLLRVFAEIDHGNDIGAGQVLDGLKRTETRFPLISLGLMVLAGADGRDHLDDGAAGCTDRCGRAAQADVRSATSGARA
ncbi:MAG: hypothetical protein Kow0020_00020 [Wenzhouxiangellaceae bacterium]